tara:strand:+ start:374 stop:712 length:339 start_codon:yes stop_codon:yes gene_type:complete
MELFDNEAAHSGDETDEGSVERSDADALSADSFIADDTDEDEESNPAERRRPARGLVCIEDDDSEVEFQQDQQDEEGLRRNDDARVAVAAPTARMSGAHVRLSGKRVRMRLS